MELIIVIIIVLIAAGFTVYKLWKMISGKDKTGCAGCMIKDKCDENNSEKSGN